MKKLATLIPKGINIESLVSDSSLSLNSDYLKYLIYIILKKQAFYIENKDVENGISNSPINKYILFTKGMYRARHDKHKKHIDFLCSNNFEIRRSRSTVKKGSVFNKQKYQVGVTPFGYKLSYLFNKNQLDVQYIENPTIIKGVRKTETIIPSVITNGKYKFLSKYFDSTLTPSLEIDLDGAMLLCRSRFNEHKSYGKYLNELNQIIDLYNGLFRVYYKEETDGRIHSNITRLPKIYRKYVSYDNKSLVEVDLSNSIIYFLAILLKGNISNQLLFKSNPILLMIYKSFQTLSQKEVQLFYDLAVNGVFYEGFMPEFDKYYTPNKFKSFFQKETGEEYTGTKEQKKKVVKKRILAMLFADKSQYRIEQKIFKSKFPEILSKINMLKNEFGYEKLSHALFQLEAYCLIDETAREFNKHNYRKAPIFTLHDCLITTVDHKDILWNTMNETLSKLLGCAPMMKVKEWS